MLITFIFNLNRVQKTAAVRFGAAYGSFIVEQNVWRVVIAEALEQWPLRNVKSSAERASIVERFRPSGQLNTFDATRFAADYATSMSTLDLKAFKAHFKQLVKSLRGMLASSV